MKKNKQQKLKKLFLILTSCIILISSFLTISNVYKSYGLDVYKTSHIEITVKKGDTLWQIAQKHSKNKDLREIIYEIQNLNSLTDSSIYPGQTLKIPTL